MNTEKQDVCPTCSGEKIIPGICECSSEWRGTKNDNDWDDCQCTPDETCTTCSGTGTVSVEN